MKLPVVYYQIKKIKSFWLKSNSSQKEEMIQIFDDYLKQIEKATLEETLDTTEYFDL